MCRDGAWLLSRNAVERIHEQERHQPKRGREGGNRRPSSYSRPRNECQMTEREWRKDSQHNFAPLNVAMTSYNNSGALSLGVNH